MIEQQFGCLHARLVGYILCTNERAYEVRWKAASELATEIVPVSALSAPSRYYKRLL